MDKKYVNKPIIGITPQVDYKDDFLRIHSNYMRAIKASQGIPFLLPIDIDKEDLDKIIDYFDGFLFTGGPDIDPFLFGEEPIRECGVVLAERDYLEQTIFEAAYKANKPMLGICRGIQAFNIFLGGTIYQDLKAQFKGALIGHYQKSADDVLTHTVSICYDSLLGQILTKEEIRVNSFHHQAIKTLAPALKTAANSKDSVIEAVYDPSKKFLLGVQWHPEHLYSFDLNNLKIFQAFIKACI